MDIGKGQAETLGAPQILRCYKLRSNHWVSSWVSSLVSEFQLSPHTFELGAFHGLFHKILPTVQSVLTLVESTACTVCTPRIEDKFMEPSNAEGLPGTVYEDISMSPPVENQKASVKLSRASAEIPFQWHHRNGYCEYTKEAHSSCGRNRVCILSDRKGYFTIMGLDLFFFSLRESPSNLEAEMAGYFVFLPPGKKVEYAWPISPLILGFGSRGSDAESEECMRQVSGQGHQGQ